MIEKITKDVLSCLDHELYIAALTLALTLPDICGKAAFPNECTSLRYKKWFSQEVEPTEKSPWDDDMPYLSAEAIYSLRNMMLHQGTPSVDTNGKAGKDYNINHFVLCTEKSNRFNIYLDSMSISTQVSTYKVDGEIRRQCERVGTLEINVQNVCRKLCACAEGYYRENPEKFDFFQYEVREIDEEA